MSIQRILSFILSVGFCVSTRADAEELVTLGKHKAHATRILAKYKDEAAVQKSQPTLQALGLRVSRSYGLVPGLVLLNEGTSNVAKAGGGQKADAQDLLRKIVILRESGNFAYAEPDYAHFPTVEPTDGKYIDGTLWGLLNNGQNGGVSGADINVARPREDGTNAWDMTVGSTNVVVAVIDTGIRYTHRDLAQQMWVNPGEVAGNGLDDDGDGYVDNVHGINAILDSGDPFDDADHGTHVAGTIGASANDENGHVGVAWKVRLMGLKFIRSASQGGFGLTSDAIQCMDFAISKGVKLSNNSWGGGPFEQTMLDALRRARTAGHLFVAAAGNNSVDNDFDSVYPANYDLDNVVSVAALDIKDLLATFSNYGRTTVHLGAPGAGIFSSTSGSDTEYQIFNGTSMAAPHATGVAALCLALYPFSSVVELRERLISTTIQIESLKGKTTSGGRLNALGALTATADGIMEVSVTPAPGTSNQPAELLAGSRTPFFARVTDLLSVTNAKFSGVLLNRLTSTNLVIANDGRAPDIVSNDAVYSGFLYVPTNLGPMELVYDVNAIAKKKTTITNLYLVVSGPANDALTNAIKIAAAGGSVIGNNKFASLELREPLHGDAPAMNSSIWYDWSPKASGPVVVDTTGSGFDTVLGVYTGDSVSSLKKVASADDVGTRKQAYLTFNATMGLSYHIAVAGFDSTAVGLVRLRVEPNGAADTTSPQVVIASPSSGSIVTAANALISGTALDPVPNSSGLEKITIQVNNSLGRDANGTTNWGQFVFLSRGANTIRVSAVDRAGNVSEGATITVNYRPIDVPNDLFAQALELKAIKGVTEAKTDSATKEFGEPNHGGNNGGRSVWWLWKAPANGVLKLNTKNSTFDTLLGLYSGTRVEKLVPLALNDDAVEGSGYSEIRQAVVGGETYRIAVDGFSGRSGSVKLAYEFSAGNIVSLRLSSGAGGAVSPESGAFAMNSSVQLVATPQPFFDFLRWEGSFISHDPVLSVLMSSNITLNATFAARVVTDDFETGNLTKLRWQTTGASLWSVTDSSASRGKFSARSGAIGNGGQSVLSISVNSRGGTASFDYRVSSETEWDKMEFFLNGKAQQAWSGVVDWSTYKFSLSPGTHELRWSYSKDFNNSAGEDAAFIDNIDLPLVVGVDPSTPAVLSASRRLDGSVTITLLGQSSQLYTIEASENLSAWTEISRGVAVNGVLVVNDVSASGRNHRFYRAVVR